MKTNILKRKKPIAILMVIVGLPLAFAGAATGGGVLAYLFAIILVIGVDMLIVK